MKRLIATFISTFILGAALLAPTPAYAWATSQSADSGCVGAQSVISWMFKNTEPNEAKWSMDVVVKDSVSGKLQGPFTIKAGETKDGVFTTEGPVQSGTIKYELTWTDGRSGVDSRSSTYDATTCHEQEPVEIEVCRDGKIVTINEDDRLSTDTNPPCPVEQIQVCRDGKVVTIDEEDRKSTDTDAPCVLGEEKPKELPNTGIQSVIGGFAGTSALGYGLREYVASRKHLRRGLLNR